MNCPSKTRRSLLFFDGGSYGDNGLPSIIPSVGCCFFSVPQKPFVARRLCPWWLSHNREACAVLNSLPFSPRRRHPLTLTNTGLKALHLVFSQAEFPWYFPYQSMRGEKIRIQHRRKKKKKEKKRGESARK